MHPIISKYIATQQKIPYVNDLSDITELNEQEKQQIVDQAIQELATSDKTK
jgi:hypothetical protein